ncbi:uncharacterized protein [Paramormyrops kingsleyae]|uniref:uncharacterized protein n=1 Tax=Paramormyrops kingsleyae TaxID=1676925 RepID=UPI003B973D67
MPRKGAGTLWGLVTWCCVVLRGPGAGGCRCPPATALDGFPTTGLAESCCLNFSGSSFRSVTWATFSAMAPLRVLDLSYCNISQLLVEGPSPSGLQEVYLGGNSLRRVPDGFLASAPHLRVLDLGQNLLEELPEVFLQAAASLQELRLASNHLAGLPRSVFQPRLWRVDLSDNPWDCTCPLLEALQRHLQTQRNSSETRATLGVPACASPQSLAGRSLASVRPGEACWAPGVTASAVLLPLLVLLTLLLCWCIRRRRHREESVPKPAAVGSKPPAAAGHEAGAGAAESVGAGLRDALLRNQLMLRPASSLLGSSRDLYEEVEIRLGSEGLLDSPQARGDEGTRGPLLDDLETVSVTEVMTDSANREKMYLVQSTEYYSLVPEIELEDSDHGEYESVELP